MNGLKLASRVEKLTDSLPLKIAAEAKRRIASGIDIINLSVGEPDFPTPASIKEAGIAAIRNDFTKYTPAAGIPSLRNAVADVLLREEGLDYTPEQIVITNGAKQAIASTLMAIVEPGDEVICPIPSYASYRDLIQLAGGTPVLLATHPENRFRFSLDDVRPLLSSRTKAIIINNPNNPTGMAFTPDEVKELGESLRDLDLWILSDEIYAKLRYDGMNHLSFAAIDGLQEKTILINGVSKYYSMTGWRIGFAAAPPEIASAVAKIQSQVTGCPCAISQKAALEAYTGNSNKPAEMVENFATRAKLITSLLADVPMVDFLEPEGAFYAFPRIDALFGRHISNLRITGSVDFCKYLLDEQGLAIIPGAAFGDDRFVRFSFAASEEKITEGIRRFKQGVLDLSS